MKIAVCSDLHLEFGGIDILNEESADVLVLAGDICVAKDLNARDQLNFMPGSRSGKLHSFFEDVCHRFPHVIYVAGNHEHYNGDYAKTYSRLKGYLGYLDNLHILDKECIKLDDVTFIGGTLWTDMNNEDDITLIHMKSMMNDFVCVKNSARETHFKDQDGNFQTRTARFTPEDAVDDHKAMMAYVRLVTEGRFDQKFVVVGHHAPSHQSIHEMYKRDSVMNGGYASHLDFFIEDHPQIKLWVHGHMHNAFDYNVGVTRVLCNPRGYVGYEPQSADFELKYVEV